MARINLGKAVLAVVSCLSTSVLAQTDNSLLPCGDAIYHASEVSAYF